jgi:hypothetical protein
VCNAATERSITALAQNNSWQVLTSLTEGSEEDEEEDEMPYLTDSESESDDDQEDTLLHADEHEDILLRQYLLREEKLPPLIDDTTLQNQVESNHPLNKKLSAPSFGFSLLFRPLTLILILLTVLSSGFYEGEVNAIETTQRHADQHEVLLDTGCTDSATGFLDWLSGKLPTNWTMSTANNGKSKATCRGTAIIAGLPLKLVHVPDFKRTLISWTDLNDLGYTATMGENKIDIFSDTGVLWTTVNRGKDRLWHFTAVEQEQAAALN